MWIKKREKPSKFITITFVIFLVWSLLQILSPLLLPPNSIQDLSGKTMIVDNQKTMDRIPFPLNQVYDIGDRLCHQRADRSFFINGNQMPFCSRCTAIWIGLVIGLLILSFFKVPLDERFLLILILSLIPMGIDGTGQLLGFWESTNLLRVITGLITGIICGMAVGILIDEIGILIKTKKVNNGNYLPFKR
ncbi:MAG: DUF2085 domain-containing protein [Candidatus Thermoplasmatota archaeon]|nr:DUF2085 domain-containing protein [Candidatus Thermoplasmatota archaeon]